VTRRPSSPVATFSYLASATAGRPWLLACAGEGTVHRHLPPPALIVPDRTGVLGESAHPRKRAPKRSATPNLFLNWRSTSSNKNWHKVSRSAKLVAKEDKTPREIVDAYLYLCVKRPAQNKTNPRFFSSGPSCRCRTHTAAPPLGSCLRPSHSHSTSLSLLECGAVSIFLMGSHPTLNFCAFGTQSHTLGAIRRGHQLN